MTRVQRFALLGLAYLGLVAYIWFDLGGSFRNTGAGEETYPRGDDWAPWSASVGVGGESGLGRYEWMRAPRSPQTDVEIMSAAVKRGRHSSVPGLRERNL